MVLGIRGSDGDLGIEIPIPANLGEVEGRHSSLTSVPGRRPRRRRL